MTSPSGVLLGAQRPRVLWIPDYVSTSGPEALELAAMAGLHADKWQAFAVNVLLGERADGQWAAFEFGLEVARQNGKGGIYEIRELAGLFLLGERLLIHSAHEYKTAEQALDRMEQLITGCPALSRRLKKNGIKRSHGQEGIYLKSGQVLRYMTRTSSGGRGFSCDFLGLDEAMHIKHSMHAAIFPTMSARPNPQILYAGSAVDQQTMEHGLVFAALRERAIKGGDPRLAYLGYSAPFDNPDDVTAEDIRNPEHWAAGNPALGIRITPEYIEMEARALSLRGFAVERLGVGDWPSTDTSNGVIDLEQWADREDRTSTARDPVCFAFDVRPDRSGGSIGVAGPRGDGKRLIELVERRRGTAWMVDRLVELDEAHNNCGVITDGSGPAASLIPALEEHGIEVTAVTAAEHAQACGLFFDAVQEDALVHLGQPELDAAVKGAVTRPLGDAWGWSRRNSKIDISPLVVCTLALWGSSTRSPDVSSYETRGLVTLDGPDEELLERRPYDPYRDEDDEWDDDYED